MAATAANSVANGQVAGGKRTKGCNEGKHE